MAPKFMTAQPIETMKNVPAAVAATGVIVVLGLPKDLSLSLAVPGGVPYTDLHVTLAYLGSTVELGEARLEAVRSSVEKLAKRTPALTGRVTGIGRFSRPDGLDVAYISVDAPELPAFREALLCELAEGAGVETDSRYGFTPHVTLAFIGEEEAHPYDRVDPLDFTFDTLEVWAGSKRDVFTMNVDAEAPNGCEVTRAAEEAASSVSVGALRAVVRDWEARLVEDVSRHDGRDRARLLSERLDDLHTRLLAAHLASPARNRTSTTSPEEALLARAARIRSVETDLDLILRTASLDLQHRLLHGHRGDLEAHVREAVAPLLVWAAAAEEQETSD